MDKRTKKTCNIIFEPSSLHITVPQGTVLLEAARKAGVYLSSICGGDGYCGKCKVIINEGHFQSKPTTLLTSSEVQENIVLACLTQVMSDMIVTVPSSHALETEHILTGADTSHYSVLPGETQDGQFALDPLVQKIYLELTPPSIDDHTADHERLEVGIRRQMNIGDSVLQMGYRVLQNLPDMTKAGNYKVTATVGYRGGAMEIVQIEPGDRSGTNYAMAIDLGTTTVVAQLINLIDGNKVDSEATYNSQINYGEDYIRRIIYAEQNDAFQEMQNCMVRDVNSLIVTLAQRNKIHLSDITAVVCAGNTVMTHFLLNLDCNRIRREPYIATASSIPPIRAAEVGIKINKRGLLYCVPSVAGFVGGDIVAGVLAIQQNKQPGLSLFVDIGTNGEVVLGNNEWLMCVSSSAGPAFEGSGVRDGMRAGMGAIEHLKITSSGEVEYETIGDSDPVGICGSGLLDTLAELFTAGVIDRTARFQTNSNPRISQTDEGLQFTLVPAHNELKEVVINQADIDNLVRSKAGVFAAIRVLMQTTETSSSDLDNIYLAGGFGNYLNVKQAVIIGLLPDIDPQKIHFVGNTSIAGARAVLLSIEAQRAAEEIASSMTYVDLMSHPEYMEEFTKANFLPHTELSLFPSVNNSNNIEV